MKVLFISNLYPPVVYGGYERLCFEVAQALVERGCIVGVLTSSYGGKSQEFQGQTVWRELLLPASTRSIYEPPNMSEDERSDCVASNIACVHRITERFSPDVIFVWNLYFFDGSLISELQERYGRKLLYFLTDNWLLSFYSPEFLEQYMRGLLQGPTESSGPAPSKEPCVLSGEAIFGSHFMQTLYTDAGLQFQNALVVHNGVFLEEPEEEEYRNRLMHCRYGELRLLFAGRVVEIKGVHTILAALPIIQKAIPEITVRLTVIGERSDAQYDSRLQESILRSGLSQNVDFHDAVAIDELFEMFQAHDLYLFPSIYEPFSLTLINALHSGIPTIASAVGGNVEIVSHARSGLLFQKSDAAELARSVLELHQDPLLRLRLSRGGRRAAWRFSFSTMISRICARLYEVDQRARG